MRKNKPGIFIAALGLWLFVSTTAIWIAVWRQPVARAVIGMGVGLIFLWIVAGGLLMLAFREPVARCVRRIPWDWRIKFVLFATVLALAEEAVTTGMTNLAPLFGVKIGQAYITASTNYWDVVALHSVIIFVSLFIGWAWLLSRHAFSTFAVFVLFGINGRVRRARSITSSRCSRRSCSSSWRPCT